MNCMSLARAAERTNECCKNSCSRRWKSLFDYANAPVGRSDIASSVRAGLTYALRADFTCRECFVFERRNCEGASSQIDRELVFEGNERHEMERVEENEADVVDVVSF